MLQFARFSTCTNYAHDSPLLKPHPSATHSGHGLCGAACCRMSLWSWMCKLWKQREGSQSSPSPCSLCRWKHWGLEGSCFPESNNKGLGLGSWGEAIINQTYDNNSNNNNSLIIELYSQLLPILWPNMSLACLVLGPPSRNQDLLQHHNNGGRPAETGQSPFPFLSMTWSLVSNTSPSGKI